MKRKNIEGIIVNMIWLFSALFVFLIVFENRLSIPEWFLPMGRMHPMILHFPITLVILIGVVVIFEKKLPDFTHGIRLLVLITALVALLTSVMGLILSREDPISSELMNLHKWSAIILTFLLIILTGLNQRSTLFRAVVYLCIPVVTAAGHFGAGLTHGKNFLVEPWFEKPDISEQSPIFEAFISPILRKKCTSCHNPDKMKGRLDLTTFDKLADGGKSGSVLIGDTPDSSLLLYRIQLPFTHEDHMPPDGRVQLNENEVQLLKAWIHSNADPLISLSQLPPEDSLFITTTLIRNEWIKINKEKKYPFDYADYDLVHELNNPFRSVALLSPDAPALEASFFVRSAFKSESLEKLLNVRDQLISLDLSYMPVNDEDMITISKFHNLERLVLNFTDINGPGLEKLSSCTSLTSLSLSGTSIDESHLVYFDSDSKLDIYLWETQVKDKQKLLRDTGNINYHFGYNVNDEDPIILTPPILVSDLILPKTEGIVLEHMLPGVEIRYTRDGSAPDSLSSVFTSAIDFEEDLQIRAIAFKNGWLKSEEIKSRVYKEGKIADSLALLTDIDEKYQASGLNSLTNLVRGDISDFASEWLAFRNNPINIWMDVGSQEIHRIVLTYGSNIGAYIMPPQRIEIWGSEDNQTFILLSKFKVIQPADYGSNVEDRINIEIGSAKRYYKLIAFPVNKLPDWHSGKGEKGWLFVDELFLF